jgi:hypothetical protein
MTTGRLVARALLALLSMTAVMTSRATVLPEDRVDFLWHRYDGGGVTIQGPALLVRKKFAERVSLSAGYYEDIISSASIDVVTTASPYKEKRKQWNAGLDFVRGKTIYSMGYIDSDEPDYKAQTASLGISQDMFGDLTTITLGYQRGWNIVGERDTPAFKERADTFNYQVGLSQVVTKNLLLGASFESITQEGFLNNPYRSIRYLDPTAGSGFTFDNEVYPRTHTSNAIAIRGRYYLPFRAAVYGEYRFYTDTWQIHSHTMQIGYTYPWRDVWLFDFSYRYYTQNNAEFYSDLFPRANYANFMARDKELATFQTHDLGAAVSYQFLTKSWHYLNKGTVNLHYDFVKYNYDDFRNIPAGGAPGAEPLYSFNANVLQLFFSFWF